MAKEKVYWPSTRYGPEGREQVFQREEDVPEGWVDHPSKLASGMTDLAVEQQEGRQALADAQGQEAAARERIRLAQVEERRRTGSNTSADNLIRVDPAVAERAERQQAASRTSADELQARRGANGSTGDSELTVGQLKEKYASGEMTLDQIEAAEQKREKPRQGVLDLIEKGREKEQEESTKIVTREEAIAELRKHSVEIADDASDAEIEAALNKLEG